MLRLVEGEVLQLTSSGEDLPDEVASLVGSRAREVRTRGDGACGVHAAFGSVGAAELAVAAPRDFLRNALPHNMPHVRPSAEHVLETVTSALWAELVLPHAGPGAAVPRAEEAIFMRHLRASAIWEAVHEAVGVHRQRQAAFDVDEATAMNLSASIFVR